MNIFHWIVSAIAVGIAAYLVPGAEVTLLGACILAVVWGLINTFVKPVITILTLPITIVTLGFFSLVVNALLMLLADTFIPGFSVSGFWSAFFFAILLSLINTLFGITFRADKA